MRTQIVISIMRMSLLIFDNLAMVAHQEIPTGCSRVRQPPNHAAQQNRKVGMFRQRRSIAALSAFFSAVLVFTACGGSDTASTTSTEAGEPVAGGTATAMMLSADPRTLDPAALQNTWGNHAVLGNALYGTLITNNIENFDINSSMAEDFSTTDDGNTFTLKLRPGLQFSDGTPLDAGAVKANWDRIADPATGSNSIAYASQIGGSEVVDSTTLNLTMVAPNPQYPQAVATSSMNWVASPAALAKGQAAFDEAPIGAGPFVLGNWARQNAIELKKNPTYWDAPKPYLDTLIIKSSSDSTQRFNAVSTGVADLATETSWRTLSRAEDAGLPTEIVPAGGGQYMAMNFRRAPFNDERARKAVSLAIDLDAINAAVYDGKAPIPESLFDESSPYYSNIPLKETNREEAQKLFDELAAEGKPVSFSFTTTANTDAKATAEATQAQLSAFDNVDVKVNIVDSAENLRLYSTHEFDMIIQAAIVQDPDIALTNGFAGTSRVNVSGIDDPQLNEALVAGRVADTVEDRKAAYDTVQERLVALTPAVWYIRTAPSVFTNKDLHGVQMYGTGSVLPAELWTTK